MKQVTRRSLLRYKIYFYTVHKAERAIEMKVDKKLFVLDLIVENFMLMMHLVVEISF